MCVSRGSHHDLDEGLVPNDTDAAPGDGHAVEVTVLEVAAGEQKPVIVKYGKGLETQFFK